MTPVDWRSDDSVLLLNDRTPEDLKKRFAEFSAPMKLSSHVFIATSGSTSLAPGELKLAAISKNAILASARSVNEWIGATPEDVWLNPLPLFHIGGLSTHARAYLSQCRVVDWPEKWKATGFVKAVEEHRATLTSLVPTQVYDLINENLPAPKTLRAVFVGGSALSEELYRQARRLGWPVLPTFGCSEASSQVATVSLQSLQSHEPPEFKLLPHIRYKLTEEQKLCLGGPSLFTGYFLFQKGEWSFADPKEEGWFITEDRVEISGDRLRFLGRASDFVKVNGEGVDLSRLRQILDFPQAEILAAEDARSGAKIILVGAEDAGLLQKLAETFNSRVFPFERIQAVYSIDRIPRNPLGKTLRKELLAKLGLR